MTDVKECVNNILDAIDRVKLGRVTILTGGNGKGKSVVRKQLPFRISRLTGMEDVDPHIVKSCSMQLRTEARADWGALANVMADLPDSPTSWSSYALIRNMLKTSLNGQGKSYLVIDEPEVGMSEECQLSVCMYINGWYKEHKDDILGMLVITHSRFIIGHLRHDAFVNLEGMTEDGYLNREIVPFDLEEFGKDTLRLHDAIAAASRPKGRRK